MLSHIFSVNVDMAGVIVIGGGIGGLSAGVRLLQRGFSVTLVEKEPRPGGYAISYSRGGYVFDLALHVVPSGGAEQEFNAMVTKLGLSLEFIKLKNGFDLHLGDYYFQMPNDYERLFEKLEEEFPAEKKGLVLFRRDLEKCVQCYAPVFDYTVSKIRSLPPFILKIPAFLKHSSLDTATYLSRYFSDKKLMAILFQPAAFMGIPMRKFSTVNFMMMFYLLMKNGMYTIKGGGQSLTDRLEEAFIRLGGKFCFNSAVKKINVTGKKAVSVTLANNDRLPCKAIIAGNNLYDVVNKLIGRSYFSPGYLRNLNYLTSSLAVVALNLGLDCSPEKLGITSHISMIFPGTDIDRCLEEQSQGNRLEAKGFSITAHGVSDPGFIKNDRHTLSIVAGTSPYWLTLGKNEYHREKRRVSKELIAEAERYCQGLKDHIVIKDLCTPRTMNRYTSNPQGAIMGISCTAGMHRSIIAAAKLPVSNVVMGSAWTNRLGGFMQSMKSGILAAERLKCK